MTSSVTKSVVYLLQHTQSNKRYYGVTKNLGNRIRGHMKKSSCRKIYRAICKHGGSAFTVSTVFTGSEAECYAKEKILIAEHDTTSKGYNIAQGGKGGGHPKRVSNRLVGRRFGSLVVVRDSLLRDAHSGRVRWVCVCDCGQEVVRIQTRRAPSVSCGCLTNKNKGRKTHGKSRTPTWKAWTSARRDAKRLGVPFAKRWEDYEVFLSDMGDKEPDTILFRKSKSIGYSRRNCLWGTRADQSRSTLRSRTLSCYGENKSLAEWSRDRRVLRLKISYTTLRARKNTLGWSDTKTLTTGTN